jgi:hypothetical protein
MVARKTNALRQRNRFIIIPDSEHINHNPDAPFSLMALTSKLPLFAFKWKIKEISPKTIHEEQLSNGDCSIYCYNAFASYAYRQPISVPARTLINN